MVSGVRYPFAATNDGQVEAIEDARRGGAYTCLGCGAAMVARRGAVRVAHFAHKPPTETCGDPDRGLHEVAKALIVQGFTAALEAGGEYLAGFGCEDCGQDVSGNVALAGRTIAAERSVVEGTRSDVVIDRGEKPPLIVEVVVSHDPEPATLDRYQQAGVPVFRARAC